MKENKTAVVEAEAKVVYPHEALQKVETERNIFWKSYKTHNTLKMVVMAVCMVAIVVAFFVFPTFIPGKLQVALTIVVAVVALGGTYAYSVFVRRKFDRKMKEYFELYFKCVNEYVMEGKEFSDVELQKPGKITLDEFNECKLYKDVVEAGSRGMTTFKFNGLEMSVVDCAGNIKAEKRIKPVFVGKMLRSTASYKGDKPVFVYLKGNERALPPTNLEGVPGVLEDEKMAIYTECKDWKKVLNGPVMKALEAIKTDAILVDMAVAIYEGKVYVMMGYDDPLMVLPLQTEFDYKPTESYKKDMAVIVKFVEALNK